MMTGCSAPSKVHFPDAPPILFKASSNWMPIGDFPWITTTNFMSALSGDGCVRTSIVVPGRVDANLSQAFQSRVIGADPAPTPRRASRPETELAMPSTAAALRKNLRPTAARRTSHVSGWAALGLPLASAGGLFSSCEA